MPSKYYNLWSLRHDRWTDGFRIRSNGRREFQDPNIPWQMNLQDIITWIRSDWGGEHSIFLYSSIEDCNRYLLSISHEVRELDPNYSWSDRIQREHHAMKFL